MTAAEIRALPGVYLNLADRVECLQWITCLLGRSHDAFRAGRATRIAITLERDRVVFEDDGDGIGVANSDLELGIDANLFGFGRAVPVALSTKAEVISRHAGREWVQQFVRGEPVGRAVDRAATTQCGLRIELRPDFSILHADAWDEAAIVTFLRELAALSAGLVVECNGMRFCDPEGLADRARTCSAFMLEPFHYVGDLQDWPKTESPLPPSAIEVAIACDATQPGFHGFMRYRRVELGTHRDAVGEALRDVLAKRGVTCAEPFELVRAFVHLQPRIPMMRTSQHLVNDELLAPIHRDIARALHAYFDRVPPAFDALASRLG